MRVLVADDSGTARRMLELMLDKLGYEVITVVNGQAALETLTGDDPPPLAILDWMMPRMDGDAVCRSLRGCAEPPLTYLILVTSKDDPKDIVRGLESGADDYIPKPYNINELHARLRVGARVVQIREELVAARAEIARLERAPATDVIVPRPPKIETETEFETEFELAEIHIPVI